MAKKINIKLSTKELDAAIKDLKKYKKKVEQLDRDIVHELTEEGVSIAQLNASYMNIYDTGELVNGIESKYLGDKGYVYSGAPHSAFCEFGTGINGKNSQHPNPTLANWQYDVNEHGEAGWWYKGDDGNWHWTAGMPSRPYMYDTAKMLKNKIIPKARELMKNDSN